MKDNFEVDQTLKREIESCINEGFNWATMEQKITVQGMAEKIYATCLTRPYIDFYKWLTETLFEVLMKSPDMTVETMYAKWYRSDPYNYGNNLRKNLRERGVLE